MESKRKLTPVAQAYQRSEEGRNAIIKHPRFMSTMEVTEDKCGIVWERYLMESKTAGAVSVMLVATPHWWDIYLPVSQSRQSQDSLEALTSYLG